MIQHIPFCCQKVTVQPNSPDSQLTQLFRRIYTAKSSLMAERHIESEQNTYMQAGLQKPLFTFCMVELICKNSRRGSLGKQLHRQLKTTIVFVTHNIREALRLSDRVLIINHGEVQQLNTPAAIQQNPANEYVQRLLR